MLKQGDVPQQSHEEEQRLRERLKAKQDSKRATSSNANQEEERLREKLKEKSESRRSSSFHEKQQERGPDRSRSRDASRDASRSTGPTHPPRRGRGRNRRRNPHEYYPRGGGGPQRRYSNNSNRHHPHDNGYRGDYDYRGAGGGYRDDEGPWHRRRSSGEGGVDDFGRSRVRHPRSPSRSRSSRSYSSDSRRSRSRSRSRSSSSYSSRSSGSSSTTSASSRSSDGSSRSSVSSAASNDNNNNNDFTKDQRTVFVNQLVLRTTERDLYKFFRRTAGLKVNQVILLRDKRTGRHKGCAYVELRHMQDVPKAVELSGKPPDFQRFPILVKASEAEKNYVATTPTSTVQPLVGPNGKLVESQRVYVGNLDHTVTQEHLLALFRPFGQLLSVALQTDAGTSKGYAFLAFADPKESNLAIQTMSGQVLAGKPLKTGWANHAAGVKSDQFPADASTRAQQAFAALAQLTGVTTTTTTTLPSLLNSQSPRVGTVAEARASLAAAAAAGPAPPPPAAAMVVVDATVVGRADQPTRCLLVHNMYDRDQETEPGWEAEIRDEFQEECSKFGKILSVTVLSQEPGGKILAKFDAVPAAQTCAANLAGRWFDKRQLRVEFVAE